LKDKFSITLQYTINALTSMLSLAVKQDIDRRVETEALKILDKIFEERLEVLLILILFNEQVFARVESG